jgi:hypothetical protein
MSAKVDFQVKDFSAGMIDKVDDNILPQNAAQDCCNVISRIIGILDKRAGQARLNTTAIGGPPHGLYAYYNHEEVKKIMVVGGTKLYVWNPTTLVFDELRSGLNATATMIFETCANYVVGMNGVDAPFKWSGTGETSVLANAPATGRFPVLYKEKLFCVPGDNLSQIWWSESFAPEEWPAINYWGVKDGDGDEIRCLKAFQGDLVIFKNRSTHLFRGTSLEDFRLESMDAQIGCVGTLAAAPLGNRLYFVSRDGLFYFNGLSNISISANSIPRLWQNVDKDNLDKACVGTWNDMVWFSLPLKQGSGAQESNNFVILYDPVSGGSFWPTSGINASCFQAFDDGSYYAFYSGDSLSGYVNQQDVGTDDFGSPISAYWIGNSFDVGVAGHLKKAKKAFIEDYPDQEVPATLKISLDYGEFLPWTHKRDDGMVREYRAPAQHRVRWRYMAPMFSHDSSGGCQIRGLTIPCKVKEKPKGRTL